MVAAHRSLAVSLRWGFCAGLGMEALAEELGALTPEQAAAPVNTVEVSGGEGATRVMGVSVPWFA